MITAADASEAVSRWHPEGPLFWATRPRRTLRALAHAPAAVGFDATLAPATTRWSFTHARGVAITFQAPAAVQKFLIRWRLIADVIHDLGRADRALGFRDVHIDLGDGVFADAPPDLLAFARRPGSRARLIPNPYLLRPRPWLPPALPWSCKTDTAYFRGASTGSADYDANARVALCLLANKMPRADFRVSRIKQVDGRFADRLARDGLIGWRLPIWVMNGHRFLVEADGNSSSWDRYMLIGSFGGVPIRFETEWEECWHDVLADGGNCVVADRLSLPAVIDRLRTHDRDARAIAAAASRTVAEHLSPPALRERLKHTLLAT